MSMAMVKHILSKDKETSEKLLQELKKGEDFSILAKKHSLCPSKKRGGDLGEVRKGDLVKVVEQVVFKQALKEIHGPVKSKFGYHLIKVYFRQ
ncbi:MAG: peptidyl-prolyl cis-trans isomerase C [Oleiphilaceae bacterium]|jgi:peptidyl-prolyl cis-trans isomerase C